MNFDNTYVSIDLDVISANFDRIAAKAGTRVMAVIKADAYGHGAIPVAKLLQDKCAFFGVSSAFSNSPITRPPLAVLCSLYSVIVFSFLVERGGAYSAPSRC